MSDKTENAQTEEVSPIDVVEMMETSADKTEDAHEVFGVRPEGEDGADSSVNAASETPEERIARLEAEVASLDDRLLRAMAEAENVRRRAHRDKQDTARYAITNFARDMLSVADNLGRALGSVDAEARKDNGTIENLMIGVEMTERDLTAALARVGVTRMEPLGVRFDPNIHEAMFEYDDASQPAGSVGQVVEPGYMIHDRPLRPAKVGITRGGPKADPAAPKEEPEATAASGFSSEASGSAAYEKDKKTSGSQYDEEL